MPSDTESPMYATAVHAVFFAAARTVVVEVMVGVDERVVAATVVIGAADVGGAVGRVDDGSMIVSLVGAGNVVGLVGSGPSAMVNGTVAAEEPPLFAAGSPHAATPTMAAITQHHRRPVMVSTLWDFGERTSDADDVAER